MELRYIKLLHSWPEEVHKTLQELCRKLRRMLDLEEPCHVQEMRKQGIEPNVVTYNSIIKDGDMRINLRRSVCLCELSLLYVRRFRQSISNEVAFCCCWFLLRMVSSVNMCQFKAFPRITGEGSKRYRLCLECCRGERFVWWTRENFITFLKVYRRCSAKVFSQMPILPLFWVQVPWRFDRFCHFEGTAVWIGSSCLRSASWGLRRQPSKAGLERVLLLTSPSAKKGWPAFVTWIWYN